MYRQSLGSDGVVQLVVMVEKEGAQGFRPSFSSFSTASEGDWAEGEGLWLLVRLWLGPLMGNVEIGWGQRLVPMGHIHLTRYHFFGKTRPTLAMDVVDPWRGPVFFCNVFALQAGIEDVLRWKSWHIQRRTLLEEDAVQ